MERREALKLTTTVLGGSIIGSQLFLSGCMAPPKKESGLITDDDLALLDEIGETILPDTEQSPGAKAAHIGAFMRTIVNDCYDEEEASVFKKGMATIEEGSVSAYGEGFLSLSGQNRLELLINFEKEAQQNELTDQPHFFSMMKQLTIWGYFTSEPGATKALRYNPTPGRYEGCIPYKGESAWA